MKRTLLCLCGVPASGKSTLAASLAAALRTEGHHTVLVEFDRYVPDPHHTSTAPAPVAAMKDARAVLLEDIERLCAGTCLYQPAGATPLSCTGCGTEPWSALPHTVILDDTMHFNSMRREVFQLAMRGVCCLLLQHDTLLMVFMQWDLGLRRSMSRPPWKRHCLETRLARTRYGFLAGFRIPKQIRRHA
jgi:tRNA uridine 5-carbamoylmethylation protein Kti12